MSENNIDKRCEKEVQFMEIVVNLVRQFAECNEVDALDWTVTLLDKMKEKGVEIKC